MKLFDGETCASEIQCPHCEKEYIDSQDPLVLKLVETLDKIGNARTLDGDRLWSHDLAAKTLKEFKDAVERMK